MNKPTNTISDQLTRQEVYDAIKEMGSELGRRIDALGSKVESQSQPNYATFWAGAGVVLMVVLALCSALFYHFNERFHMQESSTDRAFTQVSSRLELQENINAKKAERYDDLLNIELLHKGAAQ